MSNFAFFLLYHFSFQFYNEVEAETLKGGDAEFAKFYIASSCDCGGDDTYNRVKRQSYYSDTEPEYEVKVHKGIVKVYHDCIGIKEHGKDHPCVFPFTYHGHVHHACTYVSDSHPWCATKVDGKGHLVTQDWGYCTGHCPLEHKTCKTVDGGPVVNAYCRFPFRYKGIQYFACTKEDDEEPWCATMVDGHEDMLIHHWGRCGDCMGSKDDNDMKTKKPTNTKPTKATTTSTSTGTSTISITMVSPGSTSPPVDDETTTTTGKMLLDV